MSGQRIGDIPLIEYRSLAADKADNGPDTPGRVKWERQGTDSHKEVGFGTVA